MSITLNKPNDGQNPVTPDFVWSLKPRDKEVFLILDRDGTLVEHARRPDLAIIRPDQAQLLYRVNELLSRRVAIVSARGLMYLNHDFDSGRFILAGNYGLAVSLPNGLQHVHPKARADQSTISKIFEAMQKQAPEGAVFDYHYYSFSIHFNELPEERRPAIHEMLARFIADYPEIRFRPDATSYDVLPNLVWNKADALDQITKLAKLSAEESFFAVFGDSHYDEPMFKWVNERNGLSIKVGRSHRESQATAIVDNTTDVYMILEDLLIKKGQQSQRGF